MDKFVVNVRKRKKRRTRKRLDEIRKRTFKIHSNDAVISYKGVKPTITSYLTSSRLTLMKKAIRSETMTRSKLRQEKNRAEVILPPTAEKKKVSNKTPLKESVYIDTKLSSRSNNSSRIEQHKTQDSIILFSSSDSEKVTDLWNGVLSDSASSSSVTYLLQSNRSLYDEFMNNIEKYICETGSDFLRTENIFKYKAIFQTNPYENTPNIKDKESANFFVMDSDNSISEHSYELSSEQVLPLQIGHTSPTSWLVSSSSPCYSQDSPEYLYYPHKLNQ